MVLPFEAARLLVESHAGGLCPGRTEMVPLADSAARVLAQDGIADRDIPPFPRATRDGYAVRAEDLSQVPSSLAVVGEVRAGSALELRVSCGQAAEIMTGAAVPAGADAVVMIEYATRHAGSVEIHRPVLRGENIVPAGAEARRGDVLLPAGTCLRPAAIGVAASVGMSEVRVFARPTVAILATGDELVEITARPGPTQIRNSNTYSLAAQVRAAGALPVLLPPAPDNPEALRLGIQEGLRSDLLLIAGGVSAGRYDMVEEALSRFDAELLFTGVLIQPGRPLVFGRVPAGASASYFFGLPGNPVSTLVTFELFVRPMIEALAGATPSPLAFPKARLKHEVRAKPGLTRFLPASLTGHFERAEVSLVPWQGSGDMAAAARANCFLVVPPECERILPGEMASVLPA
jgi:molybdopterin molybdotransferase